jgi:hypothetical protein
MMWSRRVFLIAGVYGLAAMVPHYFLEQRIGRDYPPAITHPEYFYAFIGVTIAWQIAFLIIATDPARYRLLIIPAMFEKFSFAAATAVLYAYNRVPNPVCIFAAIDFVLGVLFLIAFTQARSPLPPGEG